MDTIECGKYVTFVDPATGMLAKNRYKCGKWRECEICLADKYDEERDKLFDIARSFDTDTLYWAEVEYEDWTAFARHLRRQGIQYKRYATTERFLAITVKEFSGSQSIRADEVGYSKLWPALQNAHPTKRISGQLKADPIDEEVEDQIRVTVEVITTNADRQTRRTAWRKACDSTDDLDPTYESWMDEEIFAMEVKHAVQRRMDAYKDALVELGSEITFSTKFRKNVQISHIRWNEYMENMTKFGMQRNSVRGQPVVFT